MTSPHGQPDATPNATIVIVSKNRADELRRAVQSAIAQRGASIEILVIDDGSTDGTGEMIHREFPSAVFHRSDQSLGLVVQRNRAAKLAAGGILFSIDDDAVFSTPDIVAKTLNDFDDPRIGVVAIPYIDKNRNDTVHQAAPSSEGTFLAQSFIGTAYAVRRDVFLSVSGFRDDIVHQGEEGDFAIRMLEQGSFVRLGRSDPIFHFESRKRDLKRMSVYGWRNILLFTYRNVPFPFLTVRLVASVLSGLRFSIRRGEIGWFATAVGQAIGKIAAAPLSQRRPVSRATFHLYRRLLKTSLTMEQASNLLNRTASPVSRK
jgi:glycosyltransferase involved in cell wall biosynthesis